jgi:hypothetical protein
MTQSRQSVPGDIDRLEITSGKGVYRQESGAEIVGKPHAVRGDLSVRNLGIPHFPQGTSGPELLDRNCFRVPRRQDTMRGAL